MDRFNDHQRRLWQQMLQIISDYHAGVITYSDMVGSLEGALDAGEFKDRDIRQKWYDLWTPLEISRATGATTGDNVDEHISRMKRYLEEKLAGIGLH